MASYTPAQYAAQRRVLALIGKANRTGTCPVCGQPQGQWPDGVRRLTCGQEQCYLSWLSGHKAKEQADGEQ